MSEWGHESNVECVVCPDCAFTFDAFHTVEGGYSCPLCSEVELEQQAFRNQNEADDLRAERDALRESEAEWQRRGDRAFAAEAERDALREALREIAAMPMHGKGPADIIVRAERALRAERVASEDVSERAALEEIAQLQPAMLERLREVGVVFDEMPHPPTAPDDWQAIAFWIYTALCEAESIARGAL